MKSLLKLVVVTAMLTGCASYRNTSLDNSLPDFETPKQVLEGVKPVQTRFNQNPNIACAVAISGGGHRAANFATGVLLGLESADLLKEIDYFSTTSGGGFAAAVYLSALYDYQHQDDQNAFLFKNALQINNSRLLKNLRRDYQTSIFTQWIHWRCLGFLDAGDLIERDFDNFLLGSKYRKNKHSLTFGDIFIPKDSESPVRLPYWVTNATVYENGARFMFTPQFIHQYRISQYAHNMHYEKLNSPFDLPLSIGMKASASFPVLIPASTFKCTPVADRLNHYLHLVDGGLSDNLGVQTAIELLKCDPAPRKVLLIIDANTKSAHPYSERQKSPDGADVAYRIMDIGLDSKHVSMHEDVTNLAEQNQIKVVFITLPRPNPKNSNAEIFEKTYNIPTSLSITSSDQSILLSTGEMVVKQKMVHIRQFFDRQ